MKYISFLYYCIFLSMIKTDSIETSPHTSKAKHLWILFIMSITVFVLWLVGIIKTGFAIGIGILLMATIGIQVFDYDLDLGTLWKTGNIQESRMQKTQDGIKLLGSCVRSQWSTKTDLNCDNFKTQDEAQVKYETCATQIATYNKGLDSNKVKSLDIYGLDGNKNGIVCEALPRLNTRQE